MIENMQTVALRTPDMSCGHCEKAIREAVSTIAGVDGVEANASTKLVTVSFDPVRTSVEAIAAVLDDTGYPVSD